MTGASGRDRFNTLQIASATSMTDGFDEVNGNSEFPATSGVAEMSGGCQHHDGGADHLGSFLIRAARANPSISGICPSRRTSGKARSEALAFWSAWSAFLPPLDGHRPHPPTEQHPGQNFRLLTLSSTTSARDRALSRFERLRARGSILHGQLNREMKLTSLPGPAFDPNLAAHHLNKSQEIASPSPVPPYFRVMELSA